MCDLVYGMFEGICVFVCDVMCVRACVCVCVCVCAQEREGERGQGRFLFVDRRLAFFCPALRKAAVAAGAVLQNEVSVCPLHQPKTSRADAERKRSPSERERERGEAEPRQGHAQGGEKEDKMYTHANVRVHRGSGVLE